MTDGPRWRVWIDTGGTFTDCLALDPGSRLHRAKVLSSGALRASVADATSPTSLRLGADWPGHLGDLTGARIRVIGGEARGSVITAFDPASGTAELGDGLDASPGMVCEVTVGLEAPLLAAHVVTGTHMGDVLPDMDMRLATTRGTNALLERKGASTALFITTGFGDLLLIGNQQRPDLFALSIEKPAPLYSESVEVDARLDGQGRPLITPNHDSLAAAARSLAEAGLRSAAVVVMHAYLDGRLEREIRSTLLRAGFEHVSISSDLAPFIGLLDRARTTLVDAYLAPGLDQYLAGVARSIAEGSRLHVMTSAGGLVGPAAFRPKDALFSGPAGGVVGAVTAARRSGFERVIAFDMGGTSTDVARVDGHYDYTWEHEVAGARVVAPALAIESVAAGGGSICTYDLQGLRVGPESAGAHPGPACYGAGGPLTITDANLMLGRLDAHRFPIPVDVRAAEHAAASTRERLEADSGATPDLPDLLDGLVAIADERMADAIRQVSVRQGYDPADYALVAFGGAGGQHACGIAERLGIGTVIVPADAGLLSAFGLGHAVVERFAAEQVLRTLGEVEPLLPDLARRLGSEAVESVCGEGVDREDVEIRRRIVGLRFAGQDFVLSIDWDGSGQLKPMFEERYEQVYGHVPDDRPIEVESVRVVAAQLPGTPAPALQVETHPAHANGTHRMWLQGRWLDASAYDRSTMKPGATLEGPALITEAHSATFVREGWSARIDGAAAIVLEHLGDGGRGDDAGEPEAVRLELFINRFTAIAGEMGEMLRRTALSTNVKERLDFSCALLDAEGRLVVNAPHIPVHLGALGLCVRAVAEALPMRPGDVVVTNHPAFGGSHLPDVTVITPVHDEGGDLIGYAASRAHHAEIGGARPGSMPPDAARLADEGVVIPPTFVVRRGRADWSAVRALLLGGPHPTRAIDDNLADIGAAVAANHRGATLLRELAQTHCAARVAAYMDALRSRAAAGVRRALDSIADGVYEAEERLDDGSPLRVRIEIRGDEATIDLDGTADMHPGNLNATPAVVRSVVLYVLRLLVDEPLPLNEGMMEPIELVIPAGLLNPDFSVDANAAPAVVGGNTEVSQRLTDTLLKALGLAACSQGTMNNVLWGNDRFGYYETICGGSGAVAGRHGASAVHVHMTNTRITDPEIVERRYPVRVEQFGIRRGSGGRGRWRGGDGAVREVTFLEPLEVSLLTQHRIVAPYGMEGGELGAMGAQRIIRASGEVVHLQPSDGLDVGPGDRLIIETPGGGGWGAPEDEP